MSKGHSSGAMGAQKGRSGGGKPAPAADIDFLLRKDLGAKNYERRACDRAKKYQRRLERKGRSFHNIQSSNYMATKESHPIKNFAVRPKSWVYHCEGLQNIGQMMCDGCNDPLAVHQQDMAFRELLEVSVPGKNWLSEESKWVGVDKYCGRAGKGSRKRNHAFISLDRQDSAGSAKGSANSGIQKKRSGPLTKKLAVALAREGVITSASDEENANNKMSLSEYQKAQWERRSNQCSFLDYAFLFEPRVRDSPKAESAIKKLEQLDATNACPLDVLSNAIEKAAQLEASFINMESDCEDVDVEFVEPAEASFTVIDDEREEDGFCLVEA